jgi:hypothetical protein
MGVTIESLKFNGGLSGDVLNLFHSTISSPIQSAISTQACTMFSQTMNDAVKSILRNYLTVFDLFFPSPFNVSSLDIGLTPDPLTRTYFVWSSP